MASLARPGGNATGVTNIALELSPKRLDLLKETVPGLSRVAVLWNPTNPAKEVDFRDTRDAARALGLGLICAFCGARLAYLNAEQV